MDDRVVKVLKIIALVCVLILIVELCYIVYNSFLKKDEVAYFDGVNSLYYTGNGYVTVGSNNNNEQFLEKAKFTKYNNKKEKVFEKVYNKGYSSAFFGIASDGDDYVAVGSYEANKKEHNNNLRSALIVKYNKNGQVLFEKDFQVLGNSKFTNVLVVDDGYLVTGQSIYENMTLGFSQDGGAFLIKYSKDGQEVWRKNYGGSKSAIYNDLTIIDGNIYVVGKDATRVGIISKYDMEGNYITTTNYKYTDSLGFSSVVSVGDNLYVATAKKVSDDSSDSETDAMIVKYDLDCNYVSEVTYTGDGIERYNQLITDKHDNLIAIGTTALLGKKKSSDGSNVFNYDGIIGKYASNLESNDVVVYGDEHDDYFTDIDLVGNNYIVIGYSSYEDGSYLSKFITYSDALKVLEVQ